MGGVIIGNASADQLGHDSAEVAFVVAEEYQGLGVATLLIEELARRANAAGITTFHAEVLPENAKMLEVFRATGFPLRVHADIGELRVEFPTELTGRGASSDSSDASSWPRRPRYARCCTPRSVAVIGASRRRGTVGGELFHNLRGRRLRGAGLPGQPGRGRRPVASPPTGRSSTCPGPWTSR